MNKRAYLISEIPFLLVFALLVYIISIQKFELESVLTQIAYESSTAIIILFLILLIFATARLNRLIHKDIVFEKAREVINNRKETNYLMHVFSDLLGCVWCVSMWSAVLILLITLTLGTFGIILSIVLALSQLSILVSKWT